MMYVDGYVLPVPKKNLAAYRAWQPRPKEFGAGLRELKILPGILAAEKRFLQLFEIGLPAR
jgi:hypothetical protein